MGLSDGYRLAIPIVVFPFSFLVMLIELIDTISRHHCAELNLCLFPITTCLFLDAVDRQVGDRAMHTL